MQTVRLYYQDAYQVRFSAVVLEQKKEKGQIFVRLDQTCFYPEGGGQPCDLGNLGGKVVLDVRERDGEIWHSIAGPLTPGETVEGAINWGRRFDLMQQHSGEHILSGFLHRLFGCENVGFHLTMDSVFIDLDQPLSMDQLRMAELLANGYIWQNRPVEVCYPDPETLSTLSYRSKKELTGEVRIVTFPDADVCACCGTHVSASGAIGAIKVLSAQNYKGGTRVEIACGERALTVATRWMEQAQKTGQLLSVKPAEICDSTGRLLHELATLKSRCATLEDQLFAVRAEQLEGVGDVLLLEPGLSAEGVRRLCIEIVPACGGIAAVFSGKDGEGYKYAIGQRNGDLRELVKKMNTRLSGRGGGKPFFVQGSVQATADEIRLFFDQEKR